MNRTYLLSCVAGLLIAGLVAYAYIHGANIPVLNPQGPVASGELSVMRITVLLCAIVVIPVFFLLFFFAWKYRSDSSEGYEEHDPLWDHRVAAAEIAWWFVPTVIVMLLGVLAWRSSHALDPYKPLSGSGTPITVDVVALDWKWLFIYPQFGIASVNMLEFPQNSPVHFELTADAPMNSFWIPSLGGQIMVMPGMTTQLNLLANTTGTFNGLSGNISGAGFSGMTFTAKSVREGDFETWVQSVRQASNPLTASAYATLAAPSQYVPVTYYSSVDTNLFTGITMNYMMPAMDGMPMAMPMGTSTQ